MTDIYHSGIKGQKRGVRRYQYLNGTYTREGNLRYRPPKFSSESRWVNRAIIGTLVGEAGLIAAYKAKTSVSHFTLKQLLTSAAANKAAIGQAIVKVYHAIPAPVYALAVPSLAIAGGLLVTELLDNKENIIETLKDPEWKKKMISYGAPAVGAALSTISGNPMPVIIGGFTSAVATLMGED